MRTRGIWLILLALLLLLPASTALADGPIVLDDGGRIFVDEDVSLSPGEVFNGDLGVFNGDLKLAEGSTVNGDVFVVDGDASVSGRVNGNLAVTAGELMITGSGSVKGDVFALSGKQDVAGQVGGNLSALFGNMALRGSAIVGGDLLVAPGQLAREAGAQVRGEEVYDRDGPRIVVPELPEIPAVPEWTPPPVPRPIPPRPETFGQQLGRVVGRTVSAGLMSLLLIAAGVLVVVAWPKRTSQVADCIAATPWQSFGLGLLTFLIAAGLEALAAVLMVIIILIAAALIGTVILIPIGLLMILLSLVILLPVPLALAGGMVLGWVALAQWLGGKLLGALKMADVKPLGATLVGLLITVALAAMLWIAKPVCCAWPFILLLSALGLGAVVQTRFGRESCRAPQAPAAPSAPPAGDDVLPADAMDDEAGQPDLPPDASA